MADGAAGVGADNAVPARRDSGAGRRPRSSGSNAGKAGELRACLKLLPGPCAPARQRGGQANGLDLPPIGGVLDRNQNGPPRLVAGHITEARLPDVIISLADPASHRVRLV